MKPKLNINEDFICRIWDGGISYYTSLVTDSGEDVEVIDHGTRNYDSGPDYKNAKVKIGGKILTGDIEIHRDFKNWAEHSHSKDRRYNSVILHVVLWDSEERTPPKLRIKRELPTVILANHLSASIHDIWQDIISKPSAKFRLPCYDYNHLADDELITKWLGKLANERLNLRAGRIKSRLIELSGSGSVLSKNSSVWEQVLYEFIFEALGFAKNKEQMLKLSSNLNLELIKKHSGGSITGIQALLFGAGGLLFDVRVKDSYIDEIKENWKSVEGKLNIQKLERSHWNFFGQRPQNFPTLRLAYGSQIIYNLLNREQFKKIISLFSNRMLKPRDLFSGLVELLAPQTDKYWLTHYDLGKSSKSKNILGGRQRITDIVVNVLIPFAKVYGEVFDDTEISNNTIEMYRKLRIKADNNIIRVINEQLLKNRDIKINTPANEQAVIQLYNFYCTREKCDKCEIGKYVFDKKGYDYKIIYY
ncbi:MAG: DUF2851 family protein [Ignavibacteria bacterium]|nr:DUF2851 family protein [Ignavibacteria bacterium]